ncbi:MAG: NAD(P)H-quinone oxidoreductase, partial [Pseudomonadota bacterium]
MRAIEIRTPGGPEVLVPTTRPLPQPKPGEVLIRVAAAGINRPDVLQRTGHYPVPPGASDLPGLEVAGTIVAGDVGDSGFTLGDQVCALVQGGGYAEYCAAPVRQCLPVPRGLTLVQAASLPETFFTVWSNVFDRAHLAEGETLLVQGGTSGIGVTAIQMAKALGHRVFATAGSDDKCRACERLGAERGINYRSEDFVQVVKEATGGRGVDVILDMVAGDYVPRELTALADDGRLVLIAFLGGSKTMVDFSQLLRRRLTITGSTLRPRSVEFKHAIARQLRERIWPLLEAGAIKPVVHATFPLE